MKKGIFGFISLILCASLLAGCSTSFKGELGGELDSVGDPSNFYPAAPDASGLEIGVAGGLFNGGIGAGDNYHYGSVQETGYKKVSEAPSSYFSLDRNTAGYSLMRTQLLAGEEIASTSVRLEELYNYFSYDYPAPASGEGLKATAYLSDCPWNEAHRLMTVGVRSEERILQGERNNYVFLIDVSGSMSAWVRDAEMSRIDLVKHGLYTLLEGLGEKDAVSIVTYASGTACRLEPTLCTIEGKSEIRGVVSKLVASGSTNGAGGLELAYRCAQQYYSKDGNNRVILLSDGDFNVGISDVDTLKEFIQDKAKSGVYLSVIGVGMYNLRDDMLETLALNGNGNYAYIDSRREVEKVFGRELNGMLVTVAKDAKAGVTFTENVESYRLLGYDSKLVSEDDFNNSEKDAGEIGSNFSVTVLYELELKEDAGEGELANVCIRFKTPDTGEDREVGATLQNILSETDDIRFIACVAEFGLVLRRSQFRAAADLKNVLARLEGLSDYLKKDEDKAEFFELVKKADGQGYYGPIVVRSVDASFTLSIGGNAYGQGRTYVFYCDSDRLTLKIVATMKKARAFELPTSAFGKSGAVCLRAISDTGVCLYDQFYGLSCTTDMFYFNAEAGETIEREYILSRCPQQGTAGEGVECVEHNTYRIEISLYGDSEWRPTGFTVIVW